jgi:replication factor C subunit 1
MRLRASGDRHETRQQYLPTLWYQLVQNCSLGKDALENIIQLMDSYFLTKDDGMLYSSLVLGQ